MINVIITSDKMILSKKVCTDNMEEINKKLYIISSLIKEQSDKTSSDRWYNTSLPTLCCSYSDLYNLYAFLNKLLSKFSKGKEIRLTKEDYIRYDFYVRNLKLYQSDLKRNYNIDIMSENYIN